MRTLKIPNTGSHTIVWTPKIPHTLTGLGSAALATAVPYPGKATGTGRDNEVLLSPALCSGHGDVLFPESSGSVAVVVVIVGSTETVVLGKPRH